MQAERLISPKGSQLQGPLLITPRVFGDNRGFFFESWNAAAFAQALEADGQPVPVFFRTTLPLQPGRAEGPSLSAAAPSPGEAGAMCGG